MRRTTVVHYAFRRSLSVTMDTSPREWRVGHDPVHTAAYRVLDLVEHLAHLGVSAWTANGTSEVFGFVDYPDLVAKPELELPTAIAILSCLTGRNIRNIDQDIGNVLPCGRLDGTLGQIEQWLDDEEEEPAW